MRFILKVFFRTFFGVVLGILSFWGLGSIKGFFDGLYLLPMSPVYMLVGVLFLGPWYASWFGGDLIFLFAFIGMAIAVLKQLRQGVFGQISLKPVQTIFKIILLVFLLAVVVWVSIKIQTTVQIQTRYAEFCKAYRGANYHKAYSYFTDEYRIMTGFDQFVEDKLYYESPYVANCNPKTAKSVLSFGDNASILPYDYESIFNTSFAMFPGGPELFLQKINGEWYFTGKDIWYMD